MNLVIQKKGKEITTSQMVAQVFGKRHADILRAINNLECSKEFNQLNFALVKIKDKKGEYRPSYEITKDGFVFLAMGFTGAKAAEFKERYIKAFNDMAKYIQDKAKHRDDARLEYKPMQQAISHAHTPAMPYHYANEADLINSIVIGMNAKTFKELNKVISVRDNLQPFQLEAIAQLERMNTSLIEIEQDYNKRKQILTDYYRFKLLPRLEK